VITFGKGRIDGALLHPKVLPVTMVEDAQLELPDGAAAKIGCPVGFA